MLPSRIEVEYIVRKQQKLHSDLPAEFRDLQISLPEKHSAKQSRFLLFVADELIKTGMAIKNSQTKVFRQNIQA